MTEMCCEYHKGVMQELHRIIALLENSCLDHDIYETPCGSYHEAVDLIKGEMSKWEKK